MMVFHIFAYEGCPLIHPTNIQFIKYLYADMYYLIKMEEKVLE